MTIIILASCSPMNKKYSYKTVENDIKAIHEANVLDSAEGDLLATYIVKATLFGQKDLTGKTYNQILREAKKAKKTQEKEERKQRKLEEKAKKEEDAKIARLKNALTVTILDKKFAKHNFQGYIIYECAFENKTDKAINAFKGQITFNDMFDDEIQSINIKYDEGVDANSIKNYSISTICNEWDEEAQLLKSKSLKQLKVFWAPEKIMFADGSTLE